MRHASGSRAAFACDFCAEGVWSLTCDAEEFRSAEESFAREGLCDFFWEADVFGGLFPALEEAEEEGGAGAASCRDCVEEAFFDADCLADAREDFFDHGEVCFGDICIARNRGDCLSHCGWHVRHHSDDSRVAAECCFDVCDRDAGHDADDECAFAFYFSDRGGDFWEGLRFHCEQDCARIVNAIVRSKLHAEFACDCSACFAARSGIVDNGNRACFHNFRVHDALCDGVSERSETDDGEVHRHVVQCIAILCERGYTALMARTGFSPLYQLDFEAPINEIEEQIEALEATPDAANFADELAKLRETRDSFLRKIYGGLTPWQTVRIARHPLRPHTADYVSLICRDFCELHGDRTFGDDAAIKTGFARIGPMKVMLIGHHKGKTVQEKIAANFGCAQPEGYRKALLKMRLAEKLKLPIVTLVDTPGAYPGIGSEQRGQAQAIAMNLMEMSRLRTPIVSVVIGEGGSGGALGIAVSDRVGMLEHAWYSVISPEGCAAILFKEANERTNTIAAQSLALTAKRNLENGLVDDVIAEPLGGAHRDHRKTAESVQNWIVDRLQELVRVNAEVLINQRFDKFRKMGAYEEVAASV